MNDQKSTVENLLKLKEFNNKATLVSVNCDKSRLVSHVTIMEAPDLYEWVAGGEFVLTTWYSMGHDAKRAADSFLKLAPKIAAIGIKTHRFIDAIPEEIIEIAEEFKLPVFEIKRDTLFRDLVGIIANQIQNYQLNMFVEADNFYKGILEASADSDDVRKIMTVLSQRIHQPCALMNSDLRVIAQKGTLIGQENIKEIRSFLYENLLGESNAEKAADNNTVAGIVVFPCIFRKKAVGFVLVPEAILHIDRYKLFCRQTAMFLSGRLWSLYEDEQNKKLSFIEYLLKEKEISDEYIKQKMTNMGMKPDDETVVVEIYTKRALDKIYYFMDSYFNSKIVVKDETRITALLNYKKNLRDNSLLADFFDKLSIEDCIVVFSKPTKDLKIFKNDLIMVKETVDVFKKLRIWGFREVGAYKLHIMLYKLRDTPIYEFTKRTILIPLVEFDKNGNSELLKTLYYFCQCDSVSKTANMLHIHVNTLRYRLEKIKEITGKNIGNPMDKTELQAVAIMSYIEGMVDAVER